MLEGQLTTNAFPTDTLRRKESVLCAARHEVGENGKIESLVRTWAVIFLPCSTTPQDFRHSAYTQCRRACCFAQCSTPIVIFWELHIGDSLVYSSHALLFWITRPRAPINTSSLALTKAVFGTCFGGCACCLGHRVQRRSPTRLLSFEQLMVVAARINRYGARYCSLLDRCFKAKGRPFIPLSYLTRHKVFRVQHQKHRSL